MNVNGSRMHLLFGQADWKACLSSEGQGKPLGELWAQQAEAPQSKQPSFDQDRTQLRLAKRVAEIPDTPGERSFLPSDHRPAAADRNANLYWVADKQDHLLVRSAGDQSTTAFWPPESARPRGALFEDHDQGKSEPLTMTALAVTADDYLVAAVGKTSGTELVRFDLVGGGSPERYPLPAGMRVDDMAASPDGGSWILDKAAKQLLRIDRDMRLATQAVDAGAPTFVPDGEPTPACARQEPVVVSAAMAVNPMALAPLPDGSIILLDAPEQAPAAIFILDAGASQLRLLLQCDFRAFCLAVDSGEKDPALMVGDAGGNRARQFQLQRSAGSWTASASAETLPLRRFGGRSLVPIRGQVHYDSGSGPLWVPVMELPHRAFAENAQFLTPIFDGFEPQCLWDRLCLDACIPGGTAISVEARAADDPAILRDSAVFGWIAQPSLYRSPSRCAELGKAGRSFRQAGPRDNGSWELLLQGMTGRHCQLRVTLAGDGNSTPRIQALRLWYPRFSYVERFLPAVYRAEAPPGSFLDRFLANFEGINTALEGRIAASETLFDPRTVPSHMIDWLAGWFDLAIDARWDERRRRLFLANAAQFFAWRGTVRGLQLALKLALSDDIAEKDFDLDFPAPTRPGGIRIAESFRRMPNLRRFTAQSSGSGAIPSQRRVDLPWSPEEGSAGLWARFMPGDDTRPAAAPFPLYPMSDGPAWSAFCLAQFGFVPGAGSRERDRWQSFQGAHGIEDRADVPSAKTSGEAGKMWAAYARLRSRERHLWQQFLALRYRSIEGLRAAWAVDWDQFGDIPLPDHLPAAEPAIRDWLIFEGQRLPMEAGAHRFSVLLPRARVDVTPEAEADALARARHVVELEKPAHTSFDIRFYWAMNRIGEARLGLDTSIGQGSRAPELVPGAVLGRAYVGAAFVGGPGAPPRGRRAVSC